MDENRPPLPPPPVPDARPAGYPPVPPAEPFYRRHGLAFAISTAVLAFVLLVGTMGVGVFAVTAVVSHVAQSHAVFRAEPGAPSQGKPGRDNPVPQTGRRVVLQATIRSISASTWTVETQREGTVTVAITPSTQFGAPGSGMKRSDFARGDQVVIIGHPSGDAVTATRILSADASSLRPPVSPGTKP